MIEATPRRGRATPAGWFSEDFEEADEAQTIDPLQRLLDPDFDETLWEYEYSRVEPEIPGSLHEKQLAVLSSEARHRWMIAGNQSGKTTAGAVDVALLALGRHPHLQYWKPPIQAWASALTWELWETYLLPELLTWIPPSRIIDAPDPYVSSSKRHIRVRADNGTESRITGKAAQQGAERYQSARVHVVWLDEEHPETVWDEMQPRLLRHGGITIATMTPLKGYTWIHRRIYEPWKRGESTDHDIFSAGPGDNPGIPKEEIEHMKRMYAHDPAQLAARLYGEFTRPTGLALNFDPERHLEHVAPDALSKLIEQGNAFAGIDFGAWRFAFVLAVADRVGRAHVVGEIFSQQESLDTRALRIAALIVTYSVDPAKLTTWGDVANTQDIIELNAAFRRLAEESDVRKDLRELGLSSKLDGAVQRAAKRLGVMPVAAEHKARAASVERLNSLFERDALLIRRGLAENQAWRLGMNAASDGQPVVGSRLTWEIGAWAYPDPSKSTRGAEEKAQAQDPDDNTADGADAIAALRYAVMSWWKRASYDLPEISAWDRKVLREEAERKRRIKRGKPIFEGRRNKRPLHPEFGEL